MIFQLGKQLIFPNPELADEDGLLAIGGDLSIDRLLLAYQHGIFPWYSAGEPILWHSPHERFVLFPEEVKVSHSMRRLLNKGKYRLAWNTSFEQVIKHCARVKRRGQDSTWINSDMMNAYINLHKHGIAHSVETWCGDELTGGLYGVVVNRVFCGESMFSLQPNASKFALIQLCQSGKYNLIDCQTHTPHLESMGARFITRAEFMAQLVAK